MTAVLSPKLQEIAAFFEKRRGMIVQIPAKQGEMLAEQLSIMAQLAQSMETELEAFRILEAGRTGRKFMEEEAGRVLNTPLPAGGNVLRPNFGRKS